LSKYRIRLKIVGYLVENKERAPFNS
jgi:hypothetical protein